MKLKRSLQHVTTCKSNAQKKKNGNALVHNFVALSACATLAMILAVGTKVAEFGPRSQVYAASDKENRSADAWTDLGSVEYDLPTGIAGMVTSVADTPSAGTSVTRIGTSCERVMVGQRVKQIKGNVDELNVGDSMADTVASLDAAAVSMSANPKIMSDTEDIKGRVLIANVIMNRLSHEEFPDTITGVILDQRNGIPQFSPVYDGKFYEVTVTDETREAVKQALEGTDYSEGALFFVQRSAADKKNVSWFDKDLKKLFKYGVHEFYTYPDEAKSQNTENETSEDDTNVVQMVKK